MAKQFVAEIKDRDSVNAVFLVKDKIMAHGQKRQALYEPAFHGQER